MSRKIKTKIFRTAVEPVLLYGADIWTLKIADFRALDAREDLRYLLEVSHNQRRIYPQLLFRHPFYGHSYQKTTGLGDLLMCAHGERR